MGILKDKKIVITGGSMGLGFAVAQKCSKAGAHLILVARHANDLEKATRMLNEDTKNRHKYYCLDVSLPEEVKRLAEKIKKDFGFIDGLVNCAGIYGPIGKTSEVDPKEFTNVIMINLLGTVFMCHYFIPLLKKSRRGKIVNYAGGGAASPFPNYSAYAISKIGIVRFTENAALEYMDDNIDINAVAPGFVITRLHQETIKAGKKAGKDFLRKTMEQIKQRGDPPERAAKLTVFLLSTESDGITGKFISAIWDPWEDQNFLLRLKEDKDFTTLRRIDGRNFFKKE